MFNLVHPRTRVLAAAGKSLAMCGRIQHALKEIDTGVNEANQDIDRAVLRMVKAELLYLDQREEEALAHFDEIERELATAPVGLRKIARLNRNEVAIQVGELDAVPDHYELVDDQRLLNLDLLDYRAIYYAKNDSSNRKNYESVPALWHEYGRTYQQGCWRPNRTACGLMAEEFLLLGHVVPSAFLAVCSLDDQIIKVLGKALLGWRDVDALEIVLHRVLQVAYLKRHAAAACSLIQELADGIPDGQVAFVFQWLLHMLEANSNLVMDRGFGRNLLQSVAAISPRLANGGAERFCHLVSSSRSWSDPSAYRVPLIDAVGPCVRHLGSESLISLADRTIPLATTQKNDADYPRVVNLLCEIATMAGHPVVERIGDALYPVGQPTNTVLLQVVEVFGKQVEHADAIDKLASVVLEHLRLQVQELAPGDEPVSPGYQTMTMTLDQGSGKIVAYGMPGHAMGALVAHKGLLSESRLSELLEAIVVGVLDSRNMMSNRIALAGFIGKLADVMSEEQIERMFESVYPLAEGNGLTDEMLETVQESDDRLNPFRFNLGSPSELRGSILIALSHLAAKEGSSHKREIGYLIQEVLSDLDPDTRRLAIVAAHRLHTLEEPGVMALILATRDPDPEISSTSFHALSFMEPSSVPPVLRALLLQSVELALKSNEALIRAGAARVVATMHHWKDPEIDDVLCTLSQVVQSDISFRVRSIFERDMQGEAQ